MNLIEQLTASIALEMVPKVESASLRMLCKCCVKHTRLCRDLNTNPDVYASFQSVAC